MSLNNPRSNDVKMDIFKSRIPGVIIEKLVRSIKAKAENGHGYPRYASQLPISQGTQVTANGEFSEEG